MFSLNSISKINFGVQIHFWHDVWIGNTTLCVLFPSLYHLAVDPHITVVAFLDFLNCEELDVTASVHGFGGNL